MKFLYTFTLIKILKQLYKHEITIKNYVIFILHIQKNY